MQAVAEAQTSEPPQVVVVVGVTQEPAPLQVGAAVSVALAQEGIPQVVPLAPNLQDPLPSQAPSRPQVVPEAVHPPFEPPPALIGLQRPLACSVSVIEQD